MHLIVTSFLRLDMHPKNYLNIFYIKIINSSIDNNDVTVGREIRR